MSPGIMLGLLLLGPFAAIAIATRDGNFRPLRVAVAAVAGELAAIVVLRGLSNILVERALAGKRCCLVVFPDYLSLSDRLVTGAVILAYALAVAAIVLLGRWV